MSYSNVVNTQILSEEQIQEIVNNRSKEEIASIIRTIELDKCALMAEFNELKFGARYKGESCKYIWIRQREWKDHQDLKSKLQQENRTMKETIKYLREKNRRYKDKLLASTAIYDGPKGKLDRDIERNVFSFEEIFK